MCILLVEDASGQLEPLHEALPQVGQIVSAAIHDLLSIVAYCRHLPVIFVADTESISIYLKTENRS
jgi:hypothetical protein